VKLFFLKKMMNNFLVGAQVSWNYFGNTTSPLSIYLIEHKKIFTPYDLFKKSIFQKKSSQQLIVLLVKLCQINPKYAPENRKKRFHMRRFVSNERFFFSHKILL